MSIRSQKLLVNLSLDEIESRIKKFETFKKPENPREKRPLETEEKKFLISKLQKEVVREELNLQQQQTDLLSSSESEFGDAIQDNKKLNERQKVLAKKYEALVRLQHQKFGVCTKCSDYIEVGRQLACPISTHCISCKGV